MSKPYVYPQHCPVCGSRMDPNADNLKASDGEEVCNKNCQEERDRETASMLFEAVFPMAKEVNEMLRNITIRPKP